MLINRLKGENVGCFIGNMYTGCLGYADDVTLLAPSLGSLQQMLDVCDMYGEDYGVQYNTNKTVCMKMSKSRCDTAHQYSVSLAHKKLKWVSTVKYLGVHVSSNLDDTNDFISKRGDFYSSLNGLLSKFKGGPHDILNVLF